MKKIFAFLLILTYIFLCGCGMNERIVDGDARGNEHANVRAVKTISDLDAVQTVSVLCKDETVLVGLRLFDETKGEEICKKALAILKEQFPDAEYYIVGADEPWSEDVIELNLYAEGGMDREILEKRFDFLCREKLGEG